MTREEAIKELENMKKFNYTLAPLEVFDMAIKALWAVEHMPTTKNDLGVDCISRQAVRKILVEAEEFGSWDDSSQINRLDAIDNVDMLPSVTPQEPKTGCWIENAPECQNIDPPYICSECGNMHLRKTNYCDQCGAKMEEV